jgi:hypothetical protein
VQHPEGPRRGEHDQALAVTLGLLLLTGSVLMVSCWTGPLTAFGCAAGPIVTVYGAPRAARRIRQRRAVRRLLRDVLRPE